MHCSDTLRGAISLITVFWFLQCNDLACLICWEFYSPWPSHWISLSYLIETQLRSFKAAMFNWSFCTFGFFPKLLEESLFYFRANFVLCAVSALLKSCSFLLQTSLRLGVVSNVKHDSLGRRNLRVLYTTKSCYPYLLSTEGFDTPSEHVFMQVPPLCLS